MKTAARKSRKRILKSYIVNTHSLLETAYFIAGLIGIALIVCQMYDAAKTRRQDLSLTFVERFDSEPYSTYVFTLVNSWIASSEVIDRIVAEQKGLQEEQLMQLIRLSVEQNEDGKLKVAMLEMAGFLDQLNICLENTLCDRKIADAYFKDFITQFRCFYDRYLLEEHEDFLSVRYREDSEDFFSMPRCEAE